VATVSHSSLVDRALARLDPGPGGAARPVVGLVGADAVGPEAFLNAAGTGELAARLPTLVVATAIKLLPAEAFARLAGPGFEAVPLRAVAAVVVGPEVLSPAEAGRMAANVTGTRPDPEEAAMTEDPGPALSVALAYYHAWTGKDVDRAMTHVADDVVCDSPLGRIEGAQGLRAFMAPFAGMLKRSDLIAAFGDDQTAVLIYNPHTTLVEDAPSGECFTVRDGRIVHSLLVFDRTPFDEARRRSN
jgi:limonene-1,2-epoxide hydrolase